MSRIYTVRLVRPVFQHATVEVQAWSQSSAVNKVKRITKTLSETEWKTPDFNNGDYEVHVQSIIDNQHVYENSANPHRQISEFRAGTGDSGEIRYLLLAADPETGAGELLMQPWFAQCDQTLQAELCSDWSEMIEFVIENDGIDASDVQISVVEEKPDNENVVHFPTRDLDEEVVEAESESGA
ncbi:MAG: hypothetical protein OEM91_05275 [Hyphomicrobiales bacterium]|nr:hypothetical protein [Hyphomicrobiales bacterium]